MFFHHPLNNPAALRGESEETEITEVELREVVWVGYKGFPCPGGDEGFVWCEEGRVLRVVGRWGRRGWEGCTSCDSGVGMAMRAVVVLVAWVSAVVMTS
jgi:hypothetical protein